VRRCAEQRLLSSAREQLKVRPNNRGSDWRRNKRQVEVKAENKRCNDQDTQQQFSEGVIQSEAQRRVRMNVWCRWQASCSEVALNSGLSWQRGVAMPASAFETAEAGGNTR
jgi:hypothetical protein